MGRKETAGVPDHVPEDWVRRYGSGRTAREGNASLTRLVIWLVIVSGIGAVVAWLVAGGAGIVAVVVPAAVIGGGGVLILRWLVGTDSA